MVAQSYSKIDESCGDLEAYPRLRNVIDSLKPDGVFNDVKLLPGWLVVIDTGPGAGRDGSRFPFENAGTT